MGNAPEPPAAAVGGVRSAAVARCSGGVAGTLKNPKSVSNW